MNPLEQRVVELETRVAFQDDTLEALNEVIITLRGELDQMRENLAQVTRRIRQLTRADDEEGQ
ncbi:MAG: SlyX family protein [Proteobacteria bacterium]|nr:SlyX family protein [Pseudomonadota bacterium]MBU1687807.1 SlyX family protein [Pseudomonadota bacterium]